MSRRLLTVAIANPHDIVTARQRARQIAALVGFDARDQTRLATAVSEVARNACGHAGGGEAVFTIEGEQAPQRLQIRIGDRGPGIDRVDDVLDGRAGGQGIARSRRLVDRFDIRSTPGQGTIVTLSKLIPSAASAFTGARIATIAAELSQHPAAGSLAELDQQHRELVRALDELRERDDAVARLSRELEATNRGVVALYAELDERADQLRRVDEIKTRFFSNMSHELRTPLNSIRALSRLLLDRADGPLTEEQAKQVAFIRKATEDLTQIVDDLLDLAKIAAGKTEVRPSVFSIEALFGMLRGMLRPLLANDRVELYFDDASALPMLNTDEAKLSQILRNLVSNALKFTERGEVRVSAEGSADGAHLRIRVRDTGIGIAPEDRERIFEEFTQIASPLQARVKGTGLGLPLCRRLAGLLGGSLTVESELGAGSTFVLTVPTRYRTNEPAQAPHAAGSVEALVAEDDALCRPQVLIVDDDASARYTLRRLFDPSRYHVTEADTGTHGLSAALALPPALLILDMQLPDRGGADVLQHLRRSERTQHVPVAIVTSLDLGTDERADLERLGAAVYSKAAMAQAHFAQALRALVRGDRAGGA